jgi:hypothetical protein
VSSVGNTGEAHTGFWWGDLMERHNLEELGADWRVITKVIFKKYDGSMDMELV